MVGGAWEWTAGYVAPSSGNYQTYGGKLKEENSGNSSKYKSKYEGTSTADTNYANVTNKKRKGEAIWETSTAGNADGSSWFGDGNSFLESFNSFAGRGGGWSSGTSAGVFAFSRSMGCCYYHIGFRPVLVCE